MSDEVSEIRLTLLEQEVAQLRQANTQLTDFVVGVRDGLAQRITALEPRRDEPPFRATATHDDDPAHVCGLCGCAYVGDHGDCDAIPFPLAAEAASDVPCGPQDPQPAD